MNNTNCNDNCCSMSKCDIFDFMAKYVGLTVIHPGGFKATQKLVSCLRIGENTQVIDIACGKGSTAFYLAEEYNCDVMVDIPVKLTTCSGLNLPLIHLSHSLVLKTASIKMNRLIAYAEAFAIATAITQKSSLLTGDPELKDVRDIPIIRIGK